MKKIFFQSQLSKARRVLFACALSYISFCVNMSSLEDIAAKALIVCAPKQHKKLKKREIWGGQIRKTFLWSLKNYP